MANIWELIAYHLCFGIGGKTRKDLTNSRKFDLNPSRDGEDLSLKYLYCQAGAVRSLIINLRHVSGTVGW